MLASACSLSTEIADLVSSCACVAYPSELREDNVPAYVLYVDGTAVRYWLWVWLVRE